MKWTRKDGPRWETEVDSYYMAIAQLENGTFVLHSWTGEGYTTYRVGAPENSIEGCMKTAREYLALTIACIRAELDEPDEIV